MKPTWSLDIDPLLFIHLIGAEATVKLLYGNQSRSLDLYQKQVGDEIHYWAAPTIVTFKPAPDKPTHCRMKIGDKIIASMPMPEIFPYVSQIRLDFDKPIKLIGIKNAPTGLPN